MDETQQLIQHIIEGIQEKKGRSITVADLSGIGDTICKYFIICQGNTPMQTTAIADSVREYVRLHSGVKPSFVDGMRNAEWIAMDYANILVHIFLPETRRFYDLEHLWADAQLKEIPDLD